MKPESVDEMLSLEEQDCGVGGSNTLCSDAGDLGNGAGGLTVRRSWFGAVSLNKSKFTA